jgi:hypothetical protein
MKTRQVRPMLSIVDAGQIENASRNAYYIVDAGQTRQVRQVGDIVVAGEKEIVSGPARGRHRPSIYSKV